MYRHSVLAGAILAAAVTTVSAAGANAQQFQANFSGFQELGALNAETGAILSTGQGTLALNLNQPAGTLTFTLTYSGLSEPVTQAHIHFGKVHVPGGIIVFFCTNINNGPVGTQACPAGGGPFRRTCGCAVVGYRLWEHPHHQIPGGRNSRPDTPG